ncbi:MAG: hypothetical protein MUE98_11075 [Rhodobacteraceae bacterium]|jgi:hypothetical protein|nr:hypothetical protein [Paracoccaceae bacterium]
MTRLAGLLVAALLLAGCVTEPGGAVRPGATQALDQDALRPPAGVRYDYTLQRRGEPVVLSLSYVSRRLSATRYRYEGVMAAPLPTGLDPGLRAAMAEFMADVFDGAAVRVSGDALVFPMRIDADQRFRATRTTISGSPATHTPHDCFAQIGSCRSTIRDESGTVSTVTKTTEAGGLWRSVTRVVAGGQPGEPTRTTAIYSIDENGVIFDGEFRTTLPDGTVDVMRMRRISPGVGP